MKLTNEMKMGFEVGLGSLKDLLEIGPPMPYKEIIHLLETILANRDYVLEKTIAIINEKRPSNDKLQ